MINPNCRARHHVFPESTAPCACPQRPQDYMQRTGFPVVPLAECYERGIIPRPKSERPK